MTLKDRFSKIAEKIATACGHPLAFCIAVLIIIAWLSTGSSYNWSEKHSLFINTVTTVVTFLLGFLILNTANRAGKAEQLKLDEIIRVLGKANNTFVKLEEKTVDEVNAMEKEIKKTVVEENESE